MTFEHVYDQYERPLQDLRISIIDKCNFRCSYCMPAEIFGDDYAFLPEDKLLSFSEIERVVRLFTKLGVKKLRLTGGEPLMRKDAHLLIRRLAAIEGIEDIALTTNGVFLVKEAKRLKEAGLQRVNVSLDAITEPIFQKMNGRNVKPKAVLRGIDAAVKAGLDVKVNMVVKKGVNDCEVLNMASYFKDQHITLRFIEFMDVGQTNGWNFAEVVTKQELMEQVSILGELEPVDKDYLGEVASKYRYKGTNVEVGFISSVSDTFCGNCTRARISADGKLYTCLFAEEGHSLVESLRSNATDQEILTTVQGIWNKRFDRYSELRTEESMKKRKKIEMSYIGG
ncbi:GTP 3',8-cyclase MoaA [Alkalihalobacillus hemicellulosilyticus]|uniref:GTP 3',8-cyclase n=1 Tax=Halalkalibacter hemicellulosilyticusJCM 9152 TaxID=1236971 RepID=W4QD56_9BACI|nr:GTP 3',8-cyclase MoaA [Halalkalibacter hemicellulosilyticus]GAE29981.1 molybdenum cofactor biosynthesis protein MoaA [Halalkalibacter hemicellulosilyticusJCM 9152]